MAIQINIYRHRRSRFSNPISFPTGKHVAEVPEEPERERRGGARVLGGVQQNADVHRTVFEVQEQGDHRGRAEPVGQQKIAQVRAGIHRQPVSAAGRRSQITHTQSGRQIRRRRTATDPRRHTSQTQHSVLTFCPYT